MAVSDENLVLLGSAIQLVSEISTRVFLAEGTDAEDIPPLESVELVAVATLNRALNKGVNNA